MSHAVKTNGKEWKTPETLAPERQTLANNSTIRNMKTKIILWATIIIIILVVNFILITSYRRVGCLNIVSYEDGYAIYDSERSITYIANGNKETVSIAKDDRLLVTIGGNFKLKGDDFWNTAKAYPDVDRAQAIVIDDSIDGIPDYLVSTDPEFRQNPKFRERLKLRTYAVDENGGLVCEITTRNGKIILSEIEQK
jgi:hypothetical protein